MLLAERYRLDAPVARGGMGDVWRGWDERLARPVALKLLPERAAGDVVSLARFEREARTAARLNHPHLVAVHDFGISGDRCFLVMELVEGRSLADVLRDAGPLPADRVAAIGAQVAAGLAAAHERGVVHRDVKPANLLLAEDGTVKIADFGIAGAVGGAGGTTAVELTQDGAVMGTSLYMAPEAALGQPAGPAADVYSLGCTLYELLTARPPFAAESPLAVLRMHVEETPADPGELRPGLPAALGGYVLGMLAKDPRARPAAGEAADWFADDRAHRGGAGEPALLAPDDAPRRTAAAPTTPHRRPARTSGGRRVRALSVGAAAATALTAAGLALAPSAVDGDAHPHAPHAATQSAGHPAAHASNGPGRQTRPGPVPVSDTSARTPAHGPHAARGPAGDDPSGAPASAAPSTSPSTSPAAPLAPHGARSTPTTAPSATTPAPAPSTTAPSPTPTSPSPTGTADPTPSPSHADETPGT